jgi:dienelactone hydrolase
MPVQLNRLRNEYKPQAVRAEVSKFLAGVASFAVLANVSLKKSVCLLWRAMTPLKAGRCAAVLRLFAAAVLSLAFSANASTEVQFPSFDTPGGQAVQLKAFWFPVPEQVALLPRPAMVLLHGCGGPYNARGHLSQRMLDYTALLHNQGVHVLVLDSLSPRGERELCTQKIGTRQVNMLERRLDALAATAWLASQSVVDATRIGLMGWSNGGSAVLSATNERHTEVAAAAVKPSFAVAFYPGCETELKRGYQHSARVMLLVGEADDWTPAAPCKRLAQQAQRSSEARDASLEIETYAGAFHGFDSTAPLRVRKDVPNGVNPGRGVTVGGNAEALEKSRAKLIQFITTR